MIGRRAPLWQWLVPAAVFLGTLVPAWLLGWPAWQLLKVYPDQAALVEFPGKLANAWIAATIFASHSSRPFFALGYIAAAAACVAIAALAATSFRDRKTMLVLGLLSATALPFLLPKMLERYYFLGDVLALALALSFQTRRSALIAIGIQGASLLSMLTYIYWYHWPYPALAGPPLALAALILIVSLARECGASFPSFSAFARLQRPASVERTAA
jgi:hypothetical protein